MKRKFVQYIIATLVILAANGCQDDFIQNEHIGDGKADVSATLDFTPMYSALDQTRSAGNALKGISSLHVLLYDKNKSLLRCWKIEDYTLSEPYRTDADAENGLKTAETTTKRATFKLPEEIAFGKYYMYAVANIPDLPDRHADAIQTVDGLKGILLTWDTGNLVGNSQSMGFFTKSSESVQVADDESLVVNEKSVKLHAWLRRAASKVTVAFDASNLNDGIRIYFKSLTIKHIPRTCYLGRDNTPGYKSTAFEPNGKNRDEELHEDGEAFYYNGKPDDPGNQDFASWPFVSRGKRIYGLLAPDQTTQPATVEEYHTENTPALYFYENLQGNGTSKPGIKDKRQDSDSNGELDAPGLPGDKTYCSKDGVEFGTYIEVEAYYDARLSDRPGEGKIIYRFMLGQDVIKDYNARRNCHYKLTLRFNHYANDVDWHIEYRDDKELSAPNPYYISYLYNQEARIPVKIKGSNLSNVKMEVKVIENHWWPTIENEEDTYEYADTAKVYATTRYKREAVWYGFLSLKKETNKIIGDDKHYETHKDWIEQEWKNKKCGERTFDDITVGDHGDYSVEEVETGGLHLKMPFYTRPKQMIPTSGYTGNNVFVAYSREAKLQMVLRDKTTNRILLDKDGKSLIDTVSVIQVRRCVNPKGVWRSWDHDESFHVVMKILPYETAETFQTYLSMGPWRAKVEVDPDNLVSLRGAGADGYVHGTIDSPMDFYIDFNGKCADRETVRSAIVLVEYNNYTCNHRIFVRQGYAPLSLNDQKIKWHTFNLYSATEETLSPLEEGSLFKFGNLTDAILAENNKTYGFQVPVGSGTKLALAGNREKTWSEITAAVGTSDPGFSKLDINVVEGHNPGGTKTKVRVATTEDYNTLRNHVDREFGYGVLYGDSATETLEKVDEVYGYYRDGNIKYGMRGCFVYNKTNGNNLFFPIGATGYGRRRTEHSWYSSGIILPGSLQYAWRSKRYSEYSKGWETLQYRPLFENVYNGRGAVYWCDKYDTKMSKCYLDINYFTLDFSLGNNEPLAGANGSACFVRCVEEVK